MHPQDKTEYAKMANLSGSVKRAIRNNPSVFTKDRLLEITDCWKPELNGVWYFSDVSTFESSSSTDATGFGVSAQDETATVYRFRREEEEISLTYWTGTTGIRERTDGSRVPVRESRVRITYSEEPEYDFGATERRDEFGPQHHNKWIHIRKPQDLNGFVELSLMNTFRAAQAAGVISSPQLPPQLAWAGLAERLVSLRTLNFGMGNTIQLDGQNDQDLVRFHDERRICVLSERNPEHAVQADAIPADPEDRVRLVHELMRTDFRRRERARPTLRLRVLWNEGDGVEL